MRIDTPNQVRFRIMLSLRATNTSLRAIARHAHIPFRSFGRLVQGLNGKRTLPDYLPTIAHAFGVPVFWLASGADPGLRFLIQQIAVLDAFLISARRRDIQSFMQFLSGTILSEGEQMAGDGKVLPQYLLGGGFHGV